MPHESDAGMSGKRRAVHIAVLACALLAMLAFGVVPALRASPRAMTDFEYFYAAGACLNHDENPYEQATFSRQHEAVTGEPTETHFYYPPQFAPFCMLFASMSFSAARFVIVALNVAGALAIAWVAWRRCAGSTHSPHQSALLMAGAAAAAFALAYPGTARLIEVGQASLIAGGLVLLSWHLAARHAALDSRVRGNDGTQHAARSTQHATRHGDQWVAGVLLGVATFKPHFALVPFVWFLLSGNWRVVTTAAAVSALMAAPAAVMLGPVESIADWMAAARAYESGEIGENSPGFYVVMGVPSVLAAIGFCPFRGRGRRSCFWVAWRSRLHSGWCAGRSSSTMRCRSCSRRSSRFSMGSTSIWRCSRRCWARCWCTPGRSGKEAGGNG